MKKREERRARTWWYARSAQREHLRVVHPNGVLDCECEKSVWFFEKRKSLGCDCRGRRRGNPKIGSGTCCLFDYRPSVMLRIEGRDLCQAWMKEESLLDSEL